jgi:hypothetical protein
LLVALAGLGPSAWSKPPEALDLVPPDAVAAVGVRSVDELVGRVRTLTRTLGVPGDPIEGTPLEMVLAMPGLNTAGSMGIAVLALPESDEPGVVFIVPVTDYAAMVAGAGGTIDGAIATLAAGPQTVYARDLGRGYAAVSPDRLVLTGFHGQGGHMETHVRNLGPVGVRVASSAQAVIIANIPALSPQIEQGLNEFKDQMQMAMMLNPQAAAVGGQLTMMESVAQAVTRDGRVGLMGVHIDEAGGVSLDLAVQFRAGSEAAGLCDHRGRAGGLLARVPNVPFLLAFAFDTSSEGTKQLLRLAEGLGQTEGGVSIFDPFGGMGPQIDSTDGYAMVVGKTQALLGGAFANSAGFLMSRNPAEQLAAGRAMIERLNGASEGPVTFTTAYSPGVGDAEGVTFDQWSVQMTMDPNDPDSMQAQQVMSMLFGPSGMSGYVGRVNNGVVFTMARNTPLMRQAVRAAQDGGGLGAQDAVRAVASRLPETRMMEGYVGIKAILETVMEAMAVFGGGMEEIKMPETVPPLGMALSTDSGGAQFRLHAPGETINAVGQVLKKLQGDEDPPPARPRGPRF